MENSIRVLHTGDWHIGTFPGPEKNGENLRFKDICHALDELVEGARELKPNIIVVAGDVFHQARTWSDRGLREVNTAAQYIRKLAGVAPVVVMRGTPNHDGDGHFATLQTAFKEDSAVDVYIVTEPCVQSFHTYNHEEIQIACIPGFDRGYYRAKHPGLSKEEENAVFTEAVEKMIIGLKAQAEAGVPTVLVSHFTITGANMESGQTAFFAQAEPVVYPATLAQADYDLVCFGHIHRPQQIEGCRNTFYCGAVAPLNFNDEGQERGYYTHDIQPDGTVTSEFHRLTARKFRTVRLNDGDIAAVNAGDLSAARDAEARDAIVRVLYDCTDAHNKAFNKAALEKAFYDAGAFWVQEITPQRITITVDRERMEADNTPEENLIEYLKDKSLEPGDLVDTLNLGRPIISEATEKETAERRTGAFVPVEISVKNYRNYREETFSFDGIRFCTINGSNGVGKSSLFMDAISDALFEETREGELTGWIRNDPEARSGAIKFTFRLGDRLYRVTRTRQKSGKATLNIAECVDGEWQDRSKEKLRDTQAEIVNLIGMDSLTLKACALIMQDQYGLFLQADREARMNVLGNILGLGAYATMEELAAKRATETNREIRLLEERENAVTAGLPDMDALCGDIAAAETRRGAAEETEKALTKEADNVRLQLNTRLEASERVIKLNRKIGTLTASKTSKEGVMTGQFTILNAATAFLKREPEIKAGVDKYHSLLEREKSLIAAKATQDSLVSRRESVSAESREASGTIRKLRAELDALNRTQIAPLEAELQRESEYAESHKAYEAANARLAELEALKPKYDEQAEAVRKAGDAFTELERRHDEEKREAERRLETLRGKVRLLENSGCPHPAEAHCQFLADALKAREEIPALEAERDEAEARYKNARSSAANALKCAQDDFADTVSLPEEISLCMSEIRRLAPMENAYQQLAQKKETLRTLQERRADTAARIDAAVDADIKAKEELVEIASKLDENADGMRAYADLQAELQREKRWTEEEKRLSVERERERAARTRIDELDGELAAIEADIKEAQAEIAAEENKASGMEELQARSAELERQIREAREEAREASSQLGELRSRMRDAAEKRRQARELRERANLMGADAARYERLKQAFSQDGIPHNIIRSVIPVFEATATNILGQMSGGRMSVEFVTEKTFKSNKGKEVTALDIIINDSATGRLPYASRSGGERVKAALSVILALAEIKSTKAGIQLGFLFIDEAPFLDANGTQAYVDALEAIQRRYTNTKVMAITHDETFKARFPQSVTVYKDESGSHVRSD